MNNNRIAAMILLIAASTITGCTTHRQTAKKRSAQVQPTQALESANATIQIDQTPAQDATLLQGKWEFDYFTNNATQKNILFPTGMPSLNFDVKSGRFSGFAGCNNISGDFNHQGNVLAFRRPLTITRMYCNAMGERSFIQYIEATETYVVTENSLQLISGGKPTMVFKRVSK